MGRMVSVWLFPLMLLSCGCRVFDRLDRPARDRLERLDRPSADPVSRPRERDVDTDRLRREPDRPRYLDPPATPAANRRGSADPWSNLPNTRPDPRSTTQRVIGGYVEDATGQRIENVFVKLEPMEPGSPTGGADVGAQTDRSGTFLFQGLPPGKAFALTAEARVNGRTYVGRQIVTVPNDRVRLQMRDDYPVPPLNTNDGAGGGYTSPPSTGGLTPPSPFNDPSRTSPLPSPLPLVPPEGPSGSLPYPNENTSPPTRPDLVAPGRPPEWRLGSPPANIPPPDMQSRRTEPAVEFTLIDTAGQERTFPNAKTGGLTLMAFLTPNSEPCRRAAPVLNRLHRDFEDQAVEVVGVLCDFGDERERKRTADIYRYDQQLAFSVFVEPTVGKTQDAFSITGYPTLVLVAEDGRRLWTGRPAEVAELERVLRNAIDARAK